MATEGECTVGATIWLDATVSSTVEVEVCVGCVFFCFDFGFGFCV